MMAVKPDQRFIDELFALEDEVGIVFVEIDENTGQPVSELKDTTTESQPLQPQTNGTNPNPS